MSEAQKTEIPALVVQLVVEVGKGRSLSFQTAVDQTILPEDLDELLDRITASANRQAIRREADQREDQIWEFGLQEAESVTELAIAENMPAVPINTSGRVNPTKRQEQIAANANANRENAAAQHRQQVQAVRRNIEIEKKRLARLHQLMNGKDHAAEA